MRDGWTRDDVDGGETTGDAREPARRRSSRVYDVYKETIRAIPREGDDGRDVGVRRVAVIAVCRSA